MGELKIKSLGGTSFCTLEKAHIQAFADYPENVQFDRKLLKRRGFNPNMSFAAFDGKNIVAYTLNGIGKFNGMHTAYDTGTGTIKDYRRKGLATKIFNLGLPHLEKAGVERYLLEVLQVNKKAVSVYEKLGFQVSREFNYFTAENEKVNAGFKNNRGDYRIKRIDINQFTDSIPNFWDFQPSWQNSFDSIQRGGAKGEARSKFVSLGAFYGEELAGYCVFEPDSGDVTQLAVKKTHRGKGIASALLHKIKTLNKNKIIKVINTEISCDSITKFLQAKNINVKGKQFEMIKTIAAAKLYAERT